MTFAGCDQLYQPSIQLKATDLGKILSYKSVLYKNLLDFDGNIRGENQSCNDMLSDKVRDQWKLIIDEKRIDK